MGKGDRKTKKGKIKHASYGKARNHKGRVKASAPKISSKKK